MASSAAEYLPILLFLAVALSLSATRENSALVAELA